MTIIATISEASLSGFGRAVSAALKRAQPKVEGAMAEQFHGIVIGNLGPIGVDRPVEWPPLSNRSAVGRAYIKKVGRTYATLFETGLLASSVITDKSSSGHAVVKVDESICGYAAQHQAGSPGNSLPARPFFPMDEDGNVTNFTTREVVESARIALLEALS